MDLAQLLFFIPLIITGAWIGYLVFKKDLASQTLGKIVGYFIGIAFIFATVYLLVTYMVIPGANKMLQESQTNVELIEFINSTENIVVSSVDGDESTDVLEAANQALDINTAPQEVAPTVLPQPTDIPVPQIEATAMPVTQELLAPQAGSVTYVVKAGDNLYSIGEAYNIDHDLIRIANNLNTWTIIPGQELLIPQTGAE